MGPELFAASGPLGNDWGPELFAAGGPLVLGNDLGPELLAARGLELLAAGGPLVLGNDLGTEILAAGGLGAFLFEPEDEDPLLVEVAPFDGGIGGERLAILQLCVCPLPFSLPLSTVSRNCISFASPPLFRKDSLESSHDFTERKRENM